MQARYRLEPKRDFGDTNEKPEKEMLELYEACGWEAVTDYNQFFIFRTQNEEAREIHTDSAVHAESIRKLLNRSVWFYLFESFLVLSAIFRLVREPFRYLVTFGTVYTVSFGIILTAALAVMVLYLCQIVGLYRRLKSRQPLEHNKPWRRGALWHRAGAVAFTLLYLLFVSVILTQCTATLAASGQKINDYPRDLPFVTIQDLYPEGEYNNDISFGGYNQYTSYSRGTAPLNIEWREYATVVTPECEELEGALIVHYHETAGAWIAEGLAKEYLRTALRESRHTAMEAPDLDADYVAAYSLSGLPTLILQKGNIVVTASFTIDDANGYPVEQWAELMLEMME